MNSRNLKLKHRSKDITEGPERAPARAMLRAMGLTDEDLSKPFIGIANTASDITPCNVHLHKIAARVRAGVRDAGGVPFEFGTITVSDGISMGTEGMKASLISREIIADSIECASIGERFDGLVTIAGCDKNLPGSLMAAIRLNIPSVSSARSVGTVNEKIEKKVRNSLITVLWVAPHRGLVKFPWNQSDKRVLRLHL